ncbi:MAG: ABC transporter ATP-binding protein [Halobacteriota archaeon]|nr:ABC transporter ATP-binding protein [Halobacteriota archaeon]
MKEDDDNGYIIVAKDLVKDFQIEELLINVLKGINLKIKEGEFITIMGPSGSGKSTLLNSIGMLDSPTSGQILLKGEDISNLNENQRSDMRLKEIGFIFQAYNLLRDLTALENIMLPMKMAGAPDGEAIKRSKKMLQDVGLEDKTDTKARLLSGGEQQRVGIARALSNNPSLLLADEPTGNVDTKTSFELMDLLREMNEKQGQTIVMVTHDPEIGEKADRIIRLRDGLIVNESGK